jgi:creatinine amidohydrolase
MSWKWEEFTSPAFAEAVKAVEGVCLLPVGIIERHGTHMPLANDHMVIREIAVRVAEREPCIIFPEFYFGQTQETKTRPGAIAIRHELILQLLDNVCEEIARNGLHKIILLNGHGGNDHLLPAFMTSTLERPRDFTVYLLGLSEWWGRVEKDEGWKEMKESAYDWHAGEAETSFALATRPDLVRMDQVSPGVQPLKRLAHLPAHSTAFHWNSDFPDHYAGDAARASAEKGEYLMGRAVEHLAACVKAIKEDTVTAEIQREFFADSGEWRGTSRE